MQRQNTPKNRINVQSVSFDGCLFNSKFYLPENADQSDRSRFKDDNDFLLSRFFDGNKILIYQMAAYITEQFDETIFMVGSSRQSVLYDEIKSQDWRSGGSCYPYLHALCDRVARYVGEDKLRVDQYLLADTYCEQAHGSNMAAILAGDNRFAYQHILNDTSKLTILYAQMHKIASENNAAEVVFDYYAHDRTTLDKLHVFFGNHADLMPGNLCLRLHEYDGNGIHHKREIQGKGGIDYNFNQNVLFMVECARHPATITHDVHVMDDLLAHGVNRFKKNRELMTRIVGPLSAQESLIGQHDLALGEFNPDDYLLGLRHEIGVLEEETENTQHQRQFILSLKNLHNLCHEEVAKQARFNVSPGLIEKSEAMRIANYTEKFISRLRAERNEENKMQLVNAYHANCHKISIRRKILKVVACVVAGALGFLIGGAIGLGIGVAAGAFLGPGAGVTGLAGMLAGASAGAKAGLAVGATLAGISAGGGTAFGLFKRSKVQQYADRVVDKAKKIYEPQEPAHPLYPLQSQEERDSLLRYDGLSLN